MKKVFSLLLVAIMAHPGAVLCQEAPRAGQTPASPELPQLSSIPPTKGTYVLGPGDQIFIRALEADEVNEKTFRVESDGTVNLPLIGKLRASGYSVSQFESELTQRLRKWYRNPQVMVTVSQYRVASVFLVGPFKNPGVQMLQGERTLTEFIAAVGGFQSNAGRTLRVVRRLDRGPIPLPAAVNDPVTQTSTVELSIPKLMAGAGTPEDLVLRPNDTLQASNVEVVYVTGDVAKPGPYDLTERDFIYVGQLVAMAGGLQPTAKPDRAILLRPVLKTAKRAEIPVDVKAILQGRQNDVPVLPNDMLYVPGTPQRSGRAQFLERLALYLIGPLVAASVVSAIN